MNKRLKKLLKKEAKKAAKSEKLIGIDPKSYLGAEILKQSREIIKLRRAINDLIIKLNRNTNT